MAKYDRLIGSVSQILDVFVLDAASSSGAGLANITNPSYTWWRSNQLSASTGVASTAGAQGVYSTSAWVQISSSNALGWYQFGAPNGVLVSGDHSVIHMYGVAGMVPLPIELQLTKTDNQSAMSTQVVSSVTNINGPLLDASVSSRAATSDSRFGNLDASVSSRAATADSRFANLDGSVSSRAATADARFGFLDISVSSRAATADGRFGFLDISVSSRAAPGDSMALTAGERAQVAGTVLSTTRPESYRALNGVGNLMQLQYEILANLIEFTNNTTTRSLNSVTSHAANGITYLYDSTSPNAITRSA